MLDIRKIVCIIFLVSVAACSGPQPATQDASDTAAPESTEVFEDGFESGEAAGWVEDDSTETQSDTEEEKPDEGDEASSE